MIMSPGDMVCQDIRLCVYFPDYWGELLLADHIQKLSKQGTQICISWFLVSYGITNRVIVTKKVDSGPGPDISPHPATGN